MPTIPHSFITLTQLDTNPPVPIYVRRDAVGAVHQYGATTHCFVTVFGYEYPVVESVDDVLAAL